MKTTIDFEGKRYRAIVTKYPEPMGCRVCALRGAHICVPDWCTEIDELLSDLDIDGHVHLEEEL